MTRLKNTLALSLLLLLLPNLGFGAAGLPAFDFNLVEPGLKTVVVDSDASESFLGLRLDSAGRLFAGCREALFVYEPAKGGLYQPRQLLFRFPKDAWVYDIAIRGDDLYIATHTAIYLIKDGVKKRDGLVPERLVWGLPMMEGWDTHQGMHALSIGPEGDIYFSCGDEIVNYGDFKRPDHWLHWTFFHGAKSTQVTGTGGVFRISPDGETFEVIARGLRNPCGLAFDGQWNLFANDNDHESQPALYVPGRLLHVTPGADFEWPRGWMPEKGPWRADLLDTMDPDLGRYVPVGQAYYDDTFLPETCRHCLYVAEWGRGKLLRYPLRSEGASFKVDQFDFLNCARSIRPVGVAVGRGGRIFTSLCLMRGNDKSPNYPSEIVMITREDDPADAPFEAYDETSASLEKLYAELANPSWSRRDRAHVELLRRGPAACREAVARLKEATPGSPLQTQLVWLAAAAGAAREITPLAVSSDAETRVQAVRALTTLSPLPDRSIFEHALSDASPPVVEAALMALRDHFTNAASPAVLGYASSPDRLLRQTAVQLLATQLAPPDIQKLCESPSSSNRLAGVLVAGERLTVPPASGPLPEDWPLDPMKSTVNYVGESVDLNARGPVGLFIMADAWATRHKSPEEETLFALLERRLHDADTNTAKEAAFFLRLLKDPRTEAQCAALLGLPAVAAPQGLPLKGATSSGMIELPPAFKNVDWPKEVASGDAKIGAKLFATRGCSVCHATKVGENGGGGPTLAGAGSRFDVQYLVDSVITPNKEVSPLFRWTMVTEKDGTEIAGLVVGENSAELELLLPAGIHEKVKKSGIAKREIQNRSPMPEGLIQTPAELRDLIAFLLTLKE